MNQNQQMCLFHIGNSFPEESLRKEQTKFLYRMCTSLDIDENKMVGLSAIAASYGLFNGEPLSVEELRKTTSRLKVTQGGGCHEFLFKDRTYKSLELEKSICQTCTYSSNYMNGRIKQERTVLRYLIGQKKFTYPFATPAFCFLSKMRFCEEYSIGDYPVIPFNLLLYRFLEEQREWSFSDDELASAFFQYLCTNENILASGIDSLDALRIVRVELRNILSIPLESVTEDSYNKCCNELLQVYHYSPPKLVRVVSAGEPGKVRQKKKRAAKKPDKNQLDVFSVFPLTDFPSAAPSVSVKADSVVSVPKLNTEREEKITDAEPVDDSDTPTEDVSVADVSDDVPVAESGFLEEVSGEPSVEQTVWNDTSLAEPVKDSEVEPDTESSKGDSGDSDKETVSSEPVSEEVTGEPDISLNTGEAEVEHPLFSGEPVLEEEGLSEKDLEPSCDSESISANEEACTEAEVTEEDGLPFWEDTMTWSADVDPGSNADVEYLEDGLTSDADDEYMEYVNSMAEGSADEHLDSEYEMPEPEKENSLLQEDFAAEELLSDENIDAAADDGMDNFENDSWDNSESLNKEQEQHEKPSTNPTNSTKDKKAKKTSVWFEVGFDDLGVKIVPVRVARYFNFQQALLRSSFISVEPATRFGVKGLFIYLSDTQKYYFYDLEVFGATSLCDSFESGSYHVITLHSSEVYGLLSHFGADHPCLHGLDVLYGTKHGKLPVFGDFFGGNVSPVRAMSMYFEKFTQLKDSMTEEEGMAYTSNMQITCILARSLDLSTLCDDFSVSYEEKAFLSYQFHYSPDVVFKQPGTLFRISIPGLDSTQLHANTLAGSVCLLLDKMHYSHRINTYIMGFQGENMFLFFKGRKEDAMIFYDSYMEHLQNVYLGYTKKLLNSSSYCVVYDG